MALSPQERGRLLMLPGQSAVTGAAPHGTVIIWAANTGRYALALTLAERWILPVEENIRANEVEGSLAAGWSGLAYTFAALGRVAEARGAFARAHAAYEYGGHHLPILALTSAKLRLFVLPYEADHPEVRQRTMAILEAAYRNVSDTPIVPVRAQTKATLDFLEGRWEGDDFPHMESFAASANRNSRVFDTAHRLLGLRHWGRGEAAAWTSVHALLPGGPTTEAEDAYSDDALELQRVAASLCLAEGNLPAARAWLDAHDRWLKWSGVVRGQSEQAALWAQWHHATGDMRNARDSADRALAHATEPRQPLALLAAHRLLGELDTDTERYEDAARHLDAALALVDACAAPFERALTLLALAELRAAMGERGAAVVSLAEVRGICEPLGAAPTLARAAVLTGRLTAMEAAPPVYPAGLSAREVEVLRLVAVGRTNREIAAALFLSEHTIRAHVRSILTKTGAENRTAASVFARDHGLV